LKVKTGDAVRDDETERRRRHLSEAMMGERHPVCRLAVAHA
jgi:hypothetical protein